jgi:hypothetical protein
MNAIPHLAIVYGSNLSLKQLHIYHYNMFPILGWGCFKLGHFLHIFVIHGPPMFFYLRHFTFILQHLGLIV